ncbi:uncharacterized protein K452DRAFT_312085 [Aplosporella prunicola CBS 121167]|uniref:Heterokaryon incompatibility domain-containing protein n=1 Tax=Aplosporella prunicola CBS 121167 TaxID=1176127 RepID=A0A6A6B3A5_9PEZI|nr:uncharacterized protein K452DRAFT_312085 [Aplosporella prunicola CBS 121167]KAF2137694.1 hypothetical protein K452DRAFT_312085 [Aplosporella prunicola CBS 121167]
MLNPGDEIYYFRSIYREISNSDGYITNRLVVSTNFAFLDNVSREFSRITDCWGNYNSLQVYKYAEGSIMLVQPYSARNGIEAKTLCHGRKTQASVDCSLIDSWISLCTKTYSTCSLLPFENPTGPSRLIDIEAQQVVRFGSENDNRPGSDVCYAALSYVWGSVGQLELNAKTMETLEKPQGLAQYAHDIPKTIEDALKLYRKLRIPYLSWKGKGATDKTAFGDDSEAGLPGVEDDSRPAQRIERINGLTLAYTPHDFRRVMETSRWANRGWTYQEGILSRRLLIFTREQVYFRCNEATWIEDTVLKPFPPTSSTVVQMQTPQTEQPFWKKSLPEVFAGEDTFKEYSEMVQCYTKRQLLKPEDAINAFCGIVDVLDASDKEGFSLGLPNKYFSIALCFSFYWTDEPISLRPMFPTWYWAAWQSKYPVEYDESLLQAAGDTSSDLSLYTFYYYGSRGITPINKSKNRRRLTKDESCRVYKDLKARNILEWKTRFPIFFCGMVVWLYISNINDGSCDVSSDAKGSVLGTTYLYSDFHYMKGQDVEFVVVCQYGEKSRLIAINTQDRLSSRIGLDTIELDWFNLRVDYRVVILV